MREKYIKNTYTTNFNGTLVPYNCKSLVEAKKNKQQKMNAFSVE